MKFVEEGKEEIRKILTGLALLFVLVERRVPWYTLVRQGRRSGAFGIYSLAAGSDPGRVDFLWADR